MRRALILALGLAAGCGPAAPAPAAIRLATTTSTRDSGLLDHLLPLMEKDTGVKVEVLAVGSGQALRIGTDGDADLLMTHDPAGEAEFVKSGAGIDRRPLFYNDFLLVGPAADPARLAGLRDVAEAYRRIAASGASYLSRGDDSGTHRKEKRLLRDAGVETRGAPWYRETGQGMGATLSMAAEIGAYTLVDRSTLSAHADAARLPVVVEGDPPLRNPYAVMLVNPARHPAVKAEAARRAAEWLSGPAGRRAVEEFRVNGRQLFFPLGGD